MNRRGFFKSVSAAAGTIILPEPVQPFPWAGGFKPGELVMLVSAGRTHCKHANIQSIPRRAYTVNEMSTRQVIDVSWVP